ncbi:MAG: outer rane chaperone Skp (OmpH) [Firmicutes bacterium]|nr:outer rane chaperone Skp (OmpH) [Bacillota bacterium]
MHKFGKNCVKFTTTVIAVFVLLGVVGGVSLQNSKALAAPSPQVGVVDYQLLMSQCPDMAAAQTAMQAAVEQAKKDFDAKAAAMNDQDKKNYYNELQQQLNAKQKELITPIEDKVNAAVKAVAEAKGLSAVLDKGQVHFGGEDITTEVGKKLLGK